MSDTTEDLIEKAFWDFDKERKASGAERDAFKCFARWFLAGAPGENFAVAVIPMLIWCPGCGERHVDAGEYATKPHHTHACQFCGHVFRVAVQPTVGVQFLPGFKDGAP